MYFRLFKNDEGEYLLNDERYDLVYCKQIYSSRGSEGWLEFKNPDTAVKKLKLKKADIL